MNSDLSPAESNLVAAACRLDRLGTFTAAALGKVAGVSESHAAKVVRRLRGRAAWPFACPADGQRAKGAATDERVRAAAERLSLGASPRRRSAITRGDLAGESGVSPGVVADSVRRQRARGGWPYDFPVSGTNRGIKPAGQAAAVRREPRETTPKVAGVLAANYLLHSDPWKTDRPDPVAERAAADLAEYRANRRRARA